ncbi:MAG TPA: ECF-type sigma factor, partial [Albitalea sp.]|nr:ECF-type sigma factor [Albitalea sp.]
MTTCSIDDSFGDGLPGAAPRHAPAGLPPEGVTQLLNRWSQGDPAALERMLPLVYGELRKLAYRHLRQERGSHTLQGT